MSNIGPVTRCQLGFARLGVKQNRIIVSNQTDRTKQNKVKIVQVITALSMRNVSRRFLYSAGRHVSLGIGMRN